MIFDIRDALGRRAQPELDCPEPVGFIELAGGLVRLVRVQLQALGMHCLSKEDETCPPTFAPLWWIDEHPIDVGTPHRKKGNNVRVARPHPDVATRSNHVSEDLTGVFEREPLPIGKERVRRPTRTVPDADDSGLIGVLERPNRRTRVIHG